MDKQTVLYRYEGYDTDAMNDPIEYSILSVTKCGWWIATGYIPFRAKHSKEEYQGEKKWVSKSGRKRYAYPTKEQAMVNYIARKKSQIKHCEGMGKLARLGLDNAIAHRKRALKVNE